MKPTSPRNSGIPLGALSCVMAQRSQVVRVGTFGASFAMATGILNLNEFKSLMRRCMPVGVSPVSRHALASQSASQWGAGGHQSYHAGANCHRGRAISGRFRHSLANMGDPVEWVTAQTMTQCGQENYPVPVPP